LKEEFEFTTKKIEENFSNYSAWHQRSAILPSLFNSKDELFNALQLEFELVQNAFYTEPSDQSAWFYLRWLVTKSCELLANDSTLKNQILETELKKCKELLEIEPNSKCKIFMK